MKRVLSLALSSIIVLLLTACDFGDYRTNDPKEYKKNDGNIVIAYFPDSIGDYTVNSYSYNTYRFLDTCTEDFLDITVTEEQFNQLIQDAKADMGNYIEQAAFYDSDYTEIILNDYYLHNTYSYSTNGVEHADIQKVIYNKNTRNIIYEYFYALDTDVYPISEIAYFNRFNISSSDYVKNCESPYEDDETKVVSGYGFGF